MNINIIINKLYKSFFLKKVVHVPQIMWLPIPFEPGYEASIYGEIRNRKTLRIRKQHVGIRGYKRVTIMRHTMAVHRIIAFTFLDNPEKKTAVNHKDHNRLNNVVTNLEFCTTTENNHHKRPFKPSGDVKRSTRPIWCCQQINHVGEERVRLRLFPSVKAAAESVSKSRTASTTIIASIKGRKREDGTINLNAMGYSWEYDDPLPVGNETWKEISPDHVHGKIGYHVSSLGRVRNPKGRVSYPWGEPGEYPWVSIGTKSFLAHRIVAQTFLENPGDYPVVHHLDNNKLNCCVGNLEWTTYSENTFYSMKEKNKN